MDRGGRGVPSRGATGHTGIRNQIGQASRQTRVGMAVPAGRPYSSAVAVSQTSTADLTAVTVPPPSLCRRRFERLRIAMPSFAMPVLVPSLPAAWRSAAAPQTAYTRDATAYDTRTSAFESYRRRLVDLLPLCRGDVVLDVGCA